MMNDNTIRDDLVLVEGEEVGVEVARPTQLEERDPTAGLDDEDGDTAVVDTKSQPGAGVQLESAAHEVSDDVPVTDQHVHGGVLLAWLCPVEVLDKSNVKSLYQVLSTSSPS